MLHIKLEDKNRLKSDYKVCPLCEEKTIHRMELNGVQVCTKCYKFELKWELSHKNKEF